jgi:hypothetical protein
MMFRVHVGLSDAIGGHTIRQLGNVVRSGQLDWSRLLHTIADRRIRDKSLYSVGPFSVEC